MSRNTREGKRLLGRSMAPKITISRSPKRVLCLKSERNIFEGQRQLGYQLPAMT